MLVLVAEDDPSVRSALGRSLRSVGHEVDLVGDGEEALAAATRGPYDALVLDLGLPRLDGLEVCKRLRTAGSRVPILMLTARAAITDRVAGLDAGADDYLTKPFALDELLARLRVFERRVPAEQAGPLTFADVTLDRQTLECRRGPRRITLTRTELTLLQLFLMNPRRVLTRSVIFESVWGYDFGPDSNSLDVYVGYLRRKLESGGESRLIHTVRGFGYVLKEP